MGRPPTPQTVIREIERFAYEALEKTGSTRGAYSEYTKGGDEDEDGSNHRDLWFFSPENCRKLQVNVSRAFC